MVDEIRKGEIMNEIGKIYPEFRKEVEKETDDIGPTLQ